MKTDSLPHFVNNTNKKRKLLLILGCLLLVINIFLFWTIYGDFTSKTPIKKTYPPLAKDVKKPITSEIKTYPKVYKNEKIPSELYNQAEKKYGDLRDEQVKRYVLANIAHYYIYKDILNENGKGVEPKNNLTFDELVIDAASMEKQVGYLVKSMDFGFIKARFVPPSADSRKAIEKKYPGIKLKEKAKELIEKYKEKIVKSPKDLVKIITESNTDKDLMFINNNEENRMIMNYTADKALFIPAEKFHPFLYSLKQNIISPIFELEDEYGKYAYLIIYPTFVETKGLSSIDDVIKTRLSYFK